MKYTLISIHTFDEVKYIKARDNGTDETLSNFRLKKRFHKTKTRETLVNLIGEFQL